MLDGPEILEIAYTLDAAATLKRGIAERERPGLLELAEQMGSFDGALRRVREQLDASGEVRDDATPKLRDIRRRLNPLRGRIRDRLKRVLEESSEYVQDAIITLRRDRYVIPVKASFQSRVPGIALDSSDSGATVFLEPQSVVPMNNELAMLEFEERDEVRRILLDLGKRLANEPKLERTLEVLAELDLVNAAARLAADWRMAKPEFVDPEGGAVRLHEARHPLIEDCVPNTIELSEATRLLIVTGPNAGGKTVLIKTLGVAALMAQAGLFVAAAPVPVPRLPYVRALLTDIGDEQSIEASLSTYAGHLTNLGRIVDHAAPDVLVLIDELGSGTDPDEGAALSQAILESVLATGALGLVTTHLAPLKVFASETDGVQNAAMRFDVEALAPTFELVVGQPGRSYALSIAERLGLGEVGPAADGGPTLLERAAEILGPEGERLERLLETLEQQREAQAERLAELERERATAVEEADLLREQIESLREREEEVLAAAAERADEMLQDTLERAKELKRTATTDREQRGSALEEIQRMRREAQQTAASKRPERPPSDGFAPGATVHSKTYDAEGPIVEIRGDDVVVQLGLLKVEVPRSDLRVVDEAPSEGRSGGGGRSGAPAIGSAAFDRELNIRGERVEPGLEKVRDFLLEARAMKVDSVRILHGKGTGALRDAVRTFLRDEKTVERFEDAVPYEGGHGVTVAYLRG